MANTPAAIHAAITQGQSCTLEASAGQFPAAPTGRRSALFNRSIASLAGRILPA